MNKKTLSIIIGVVVVLAIVITISSRKNDSSGSSVFDVSFLDKAELALEEGDIVKAKDLYKKSMAAINNADKLQEIQNKIDETSMKIIFSLVEDDCSSKYTVKSGDSLSKIAKEFNTTVNLIKRTNNLNSNIIKTGQSFKVNVCSFSIVVDKSQNLLFLKRKGEIIKTYLVSTGKDNSTPIGEFKIVNKLEKPTWYKTGAVISPDSPKNILGSRWMGFDLKGYGIHGTTEPESLGSQVTLGCIRMKNQDVEELFDIIPQGTEVIIID